MKYSAFLVIAFALSASVDAHPMLRRGTSQATQLNQQFQSMKVGQSCTVGTNACIGDQFAQCDNGKMIAQACAPGTTCAAVPAGAGAAIVCSTQSDINARFAAAGVTDTGLSGSTAAASSSASVASGSAVSSAAATTSSVVASTNTVSSAAATSATSVTSSAAAAASSAANNAGSGAATGNSNSTGSSNSTDAQSSLTLLQSVIATGFENDGQSQPEAGQVASKTSSNNFINFCATVSNLPITNGQQVKTGSCNPAPMGVIASTANMPSAKFQFPQNLGTVQANTAFTIKMAINNMDTGFFVNAEENYFAAPQFTNAQGQIQGHSHVVIEQLTSLNQTTPTDPTKFAFFKGLNSAAQGGVLTADVTSGLPAGAYRLASINSAANHQPVLVAVAQHGSLDDMIYFTVQ